MAKKNRARSLATASILLRTLEELVDGERLDLDAAALAAWQDEPWAGANIVNCSEAPENGLSDVTFVVTPFTGALSWLEL